MTRCVLLAAFLVAGTPGLLSAGQAAPIAPDLVRAMEGASLEAFATADPSEAGRFVAALHVPGQLLVVSAMHPAPATIEGRLRYDLFRDVYLDLQGTPTQQGKFFVQDAAADGIVNAARNSSTIDIVYRDNVTTFMFNGDARGQKLSGADYTAALNKAQTDYARILGVLKAALDARKK